jgi:tripartite-type tricarboxylate transporter receptor subunit TctC
MEESVMQALRRGIFRSFTGIACIALAASEAFAQGYPSKPVRLTVGYVPGGAVDATARLIGPKLSEQLGQPVVVDNRPGAATAIATERVAKSPPDGYTLLLIPTSTAVQSALRTNLPYDLVRDLAPVSLIATGPFVLAVHPTVPARSAKELVALVRSQPGKLTYGSPGVGSANHLAGELFSLGAKVKILHVPYKGSAEATIATAAGQVDMTFSSVAGALPLLGSRKLRPLAVTSAQRASLLSAVPTVAEAVVPGYSYFVWYGLAAPAGTPKEIITRLNAALGKIVNTPEMKEMFGRQGFEPQTNTPEQFAKIVQNEIAQTAKLIALTGLKPE